MIRDDVDLGRVRGRLDHVLERIGSPDSQGDRAYTALFPDTARQEARSADERRSDGRQKGPVDGLLLSCKSLFDIAGTVTDAGSVILARGKPADRDATAIARLKEVGAVIVGATHMTEFAFSAVGTNPHHPLPGNPHDRLRIPGGSSSGAAVSVGEGLADIAIGSDTGGSLRIPAALCGLVGFKPTGSRIPSQGAFPLSPTLDTIGPIARDVAHCAAADAVMSGETGASGAASANGFRLIIPGGRLFDRCETEVLEAFDNAMACLRRNSVTIVEGSLESVLDGLSEIDAIGTFPSVELAAKLRSLGHTELAEVDPKTRTRIEAGLGLSAIDYLHMASLRSRAVRSFESEMGENNVYVVPTVPIRAPRIEDVQTAEQFHDVNGLLLRNPRVANLLDCPSISLPVPARDLPVGLMLIGKRRSDRRLLAIAQCIEGILFRP